MTDQRDEDGLAIDITCGCVWCQASAILQFAEAMSMRLRPKFKPTEMERALLVAASISAIAREGSRPAFVAEATATFDGVTLSAHDATADKPH